MEQFERKFEDMEVATDVIEKSMGSVTANMSDQQEVDGLIRQVADEYSLELNVLLPEIGQRTGPQNEYITLQFALNENLPPFCSCQPGPRSSIARAFQAGQSLHCELKYYRSHGLGPKCK